MIEEDIYKTKEVIDMELIIDDYEEIEIIADDMRYRLRKERLGLSLINSEGKELFNSEAFKGD